MLTIYLVRHGETEENRRGVLQGQTDGHLSALGVAQAHGLADKLNGVKFDAIVSSPLKRALDTARILRDAGHGGQPIEMCALLKERDWGSLTMTSCKAAQGLDKFPDDVETLKHGLQRALQWTRLMYRRYDGKTVLAVGHGFINRCILSVILDKPKSSVPRLQNAECRIVKIKEEITERDLDKLTGGGDEASAAG